MCLHISTIQPTNLHFMWSISVTQHVTKIIWPCISSRVRAYYLGPRGVMLSVAGRHWTCSLLRHACSRACSSLSQIACSSWYSWCFACPSSLRLFAAGCCCRLDALPHVLLLSFLPLAASRCLPLPPAASSLAVLLI